MVTLDKGRKSSKTTYFLFPMYLSSMLEDIFAASREDGYKIYGRTMLQQVVPADMVRDEINFGPRHVEPWRHLNVCVSEYDPEYLKERLMAQWHSTEEIRMAKAQSGAFTKTMEKGETEVVNAQDDGTPWYRDDNIWNGMRPDLANTKDRR